MPKVTIAIPTRNRVGYLQLALNSALEQTFEDLDVVVSNNRCTDGTAEFLATITDPRMRVVNQAEDLSMVQNWNACVNAATGEYFLLLSDDDVLEPRMIEAMVQAFEAGPQAERTGFVYCAGRMIDSDGKLIRAGQLSPLQEDAPALIVAFFNGSRDTWPCSIMLRRSDLVGGYSSDFSVITDAAAWMTAVCRYGFARFISEELVNYRAHNNLTRTTPIEVWQRENTAVAALAINLLRDSGQLTAALKRKIRRAVHRLNIQVALALPMSAPDQRRRTILHTYAKYLPLFFTSARGVYMLGRAVAVVTFPRSIVRFVRRYKEKARQQAALRTAAR